MAEQQAVVDQASDTEQSLADSQHGTDQQQAAGQTPELKDVKDLPDWAQRLIRETRKDAETHRKRVTEFEDASKSDLQRAAEARDAEKQRADAAVERLRTANARSAVTDAATKANAISARAVFALVQGSLEFDEDGEPTNVAEVLEQARKDEPQLFRASGGRGGGAERDDSGSADGSGTNRTMNDFIRGARRR